MVADSTIQPDRWYQLDLVVELNKVTLYADGQDKVTWQRGSGQRITGGRVGVMVRGGIAEFQELEVWDVTEATKTYSLGGQRVALRRSGVLYYVHTDHLGSTSVLTDKNGAEVPGTRLKYYPFGAPRPDSATAAHNAFATGYSDATFTGQRRDVGTGLYHYGARYYDSAIGRFLQPDTIVPEPGNPQALNRYSYTLNNPLRYTDPSGHCIGPLLPFCIGAATCWATVLTVSAEVYYGPHAEAALFGTGPDTRGLRIVQQHRGLIESTTGVQPIIIAAGIAVQSQWGGFPQDWVEVNGIPGILPSDTNASLGIASMTAGEMQEYGGNALNPADAVQALTQKIQKSVAACTGCSATDQFIVAGMAQNGFTPEDVSNALAFMSNGTIAWSDYFARQSAPSGDRRAPWLGMRSGGRSWNLFQLQLFLNDVLALIAQGWTPPEGVDLGYIQCVVSGGNCE